ncbi:MAG: response regulator transcription factor [Bacteroidetes bacterium]|nr:response regulator transcription factor [Bacteroidota bacterium]
MGIRAIIVDDEQKARNVLSAILSGEIPGVEVVDQAEDVPSAVKSIMRHKPDLVFLDVEMPGYNGFQLLDFFEQIEFSIIFTTAYSEYALQAFQVSAVDYLLKPIQIEAVELALEKYKARRGEPQRELLENLRQNLISSSVKKLALPTGSGVIFVKTEDILYLKADGSYTHFILNDGRQLMVSRKIKEYETVLTPELQFYRPHRSYLVNARRISEYIKADGGSVVLENGDSVPIARDAKDEFLEFLGMR